MLRFPFDQRQSPSDAIQKEERSLAKQIPHKDEGSEDGLSPELSFLLSMAMKDGMDNNRMLKMFEDILPFVSEREKKSIQKILSLSSTSEYNEGDNRSLSRKTSLSGYSKQSRQQDLLNIIERYAEGQGGEMMQQLKRSIHMQKDFEEMQKKFEKLGNMNDAKPEDIVEVMSMFMKEEDMAQLKNMQNMMKLFGNMNNLKPEDMLKFMNLNKK